MTASARARISLSAIRQNLQLIRSLVPNSRVMAVIKGNAYGHGMLETAETLSDVDSFAVARLTEAAQLRDAGVDLPLVLLGGVVDRGDLEWAATHDVSVCVHDFEQLGWLEQLSGARASVWLKIDTGMNRLGFHVDDAPQALQRLGACAAVDKLSVMSHFANTDDVDDDLTEWQLDRFQKTIVGFDGDISIANSAAIFGFSDRLRAFAANNADKQIWIRPGISLYGVSPLMGHSAADLGLRAAMHFEARLLSTRVLRQGDRVGYGGTWRADRDTVIGTLAVGYGDGYSRFMPANTPVRINGRNVPVAGRVSMDLTAVDLGPGAVDRIGDTAVLWGKDHPVETVADAAGTTAYQLVTGVMHREPPVFSR